MNSLMSIVLTIPICALLNRGRGGGFIPELRGFNGVIANAIFSLLLLLISANIWLSLCFFVAYFIGESFGWSKWINCIPGHLTQSQYNETWLGSKNPRSDRDLSSIIASKFVNESKDYELYCFVGMAIRGLMWWVPVFTVFVAFGVMEPTSAVMFTVGLSSLFPVCYRIAYQYTKDKDKYIQNAELIYGAVYGIPFGVVVSNIMG